MDNVVGSLWWDVMVDGRLAIAADGILFKSNFPRLRKDLRIREIYGFPNAW
jgi:hypothetical protein